MAKKRREDCAFKCTFLSSIVVSFEDKKNMEGECINSSFCLCVDED
jgi:hypothetical protein